MSAHPARPYLSRRKFLAGAAAVGAMGAWSPLTRVVARAQDGPPGVPLYKRVYENWTGDIRVDDLWACAPTSPDDVVTLVNWAVANGRRVRASGAMHSFSPVTVTSDDPNATRIVLAETAVHLTSMAMDDRWGVPAVRVGAGASLDSLLPFLEERGWGWTATTAPGNLTIGGALAIGGHGAAIPAAGEQPRAGGTYGSLSNLVLEATAVVRQGHRYVLRTFARQDKEMAALLVHLGRGFLTEVVLQVSPDVNLRCESFTDVPASELFADPAVAGERSFAAYLDRSGRVETIWFPFTDHPWLKVWTVSPEKPRAARPTDKPYNYTFSDNVPRELAILADELVTGNDRATPVFGQLMYQSAVAGLAATDTTDLWGASKNTLLYIKPTTLRVTANGYAVLCRRADIQQVIADFCTKHRELIASYQERGQYPINMPVEIRVTGLDQPGDATDRRHQVPALSALAPREDHPEWDVAVWLDILTFPGTAGADRWYTEMERWLLARFGDSIRPEWSKAWGFTEHGTWKDLAIARRNHPRFDEARRTLNRLDPHRVFTNPFLDRLLPDGS